MRRCWMIFGAITATSAAFFAAACGSDDTSASTPDNRDATPDDAAQAPDSSRASFDASGRDAEGCDLCEACYDISDAIPTVPGATELRVHQNRCTASDVDAFLMACFESDGGTCETFLGAHTDCATCLIGPFTVADGGSVDAGPDAGAIWPALVYASPHVVIPNVDGCILASADAGRECGLAASASSLCLASACASCDDFAVPACETYASHDMSGCPSVDTVSASCLDALDAATSSIGAECKGDGGSPGEIARAVGAAICGP